MAAAFAGPQPGIDRRRHGHRRQDLGRRVHAPDLRRGRARRRSRIGTLGIRGAVDAAGRADDARPGARSPARFAALAARRRHPRGARGVQPRDRPAPARRRAADGRPPSPTSAATISIITRHSRPTLPPSCACSRRCSPTPRTPSSNPDAPGADRVIAVAPGAFTVGRHGTGLTLISAERTGGGCVTRRAGHGAARGGAAAHRRLPGRERARRGRALPSSSGVPEGDRCRGALAR